MLFGFSELIFHIFCQYIPILVFFMIPYMVFLKNYFFYHKAKG